MSKLHRHYFSRFVIDEMHCVEIWGESFRYEYKNLSKIISDVSNHYGTKIVLLTASASKKRVESTFQGLRNNKNINPIVVQKDIVRQEIKINKAIEITDESSRPKISISIIKNQLANNKNSKGIHSRQFSHNDTIFN